MLRRPSSRSRNSRPRSTSTCGNPLRVKLASPAPTSRQHHPVRPNPKIDHEENGARLGANAGLLQQAVGESPRKRKAAGPQQAAPPPNTQQRFRSPPYSQSAGSTISNPPPGRRRGHSRQTSDASTTYRRGRAETISSARGMSPMSATGPGAARETAGTTAESSPFSQPPVQTRNAAHSVSSLLSSDDAPAQASRYPPAQAADSRGQQGRTDSRPGSPQSTEGRSRIGGAGIAAPRERRDE